MHLITIDTRQINLDLVVATHRTGDTITLIFVAPQEKNIGYNTDEYATTHYEETFYHNHAQALMAYLDTQSYDVMKWYALHEKTQAREREYAQKRDAVIERAKQHGRVIAAQYNGTEQPEQLARRFWSPIGVNHCQLVDIVASDAIQDVWISGWVEGFNGERNKEDIDVPF